MTDEEKKTRKRKPAKFVIQKQRIDNNPPLGDQAIFWVDTFIPEESEPLDTADKCQRFIDDKLDDGVYRVNHLKKQLLKETKKVETTTITEIE